MSRKFALLCALAGTGVLATAPNALAAQGAPKLDWKPCGDQGAQCATATVPADYDRPNGRQLHLALARSPALDAKHRIGSLFFNFGGPGAPAADFVQFYGQNPANFMHALNERFDIVGMDPRGVGQSEGAIDCKANQETQGIYSMPFPTPFNLDARALIAKDSGYVARCVARNASILPYVSTANVARDLDTLRAAVGDQKLTYLGFSYGTFLGSTYASLFPGHMRAVVLDGPVDATRYINDPSQDLVEQTQGFERALGRFLTACAADQAACSGFGGKDPWTAFDALIDRSDASPIPAAGYAPDPRPIEGDDIRAAATSELYSKFAWGDLAAALAAAANGDGSGIRQLVDEDFYGRDPETGAYDPLSDRYFTITAVEQSYRKGDIGSYLEQGDRCWGEFDHFWDNCGYVELNYGLWPIRANDVFRGPFHVPGSASTPLIVDTTYDPATPYRGGLRLQRDLGNARLLTMVGDGHTAYGGNSACIDAAVDAYLTDLTLPAAGTRCAQDVPFSAPQQQAAAKARSAAPDTAASREWLTRATSLR